jgi:hypothetical protein
MNKISEVQKIYKILDKYDKKSSDLRAYITGDMKEYITLEGLDFKQEELSEVEKTIYDYLDSFIKELFNANNILYTIHKQDDFVNLMFILFKQKVYIKRKNLQEFYNTFKNISVLDESNSKNLINSVENYLMKNEVYMKPEYKDDKIILSFQSKDANIIKFDMIFEYDTNLHGDERAIYFMMLNSFLISYKHFEAYKKSENYNPIKMKGDGGYV